VRPWVADIWVGALGSSSQVAPCKKRIHTREICTLKQSVAVITFRKHRFLLGTAQAIEKYRKTRLEAMAKPQTPDASFSVW